MASFEELLRTKVLLRESTVVDPLEEKANALRHEVAMYDSPHWAAFREGLEQDFVERVEALINEDDGVMVRVLQMEVRRIRERLLRPQEALDELKELNQEIESERNSLLAVAGHPGENLTPR